MNKAKPALLAPEAQFARDANANPEKVSTGVDPITDAKLEILSTVSSAPVFFTPAEATQVAIDNLVTWEDSDLSNKTYDRNFKNVILSRISGTPTQVEIVERVAKKTGAITKVEQAISNIEMPHSTGMIVGLEEKGKQKRVLQYAGGRLIQVSLSELGEACPFAKMSASENTVDMVINFFELHHDLDLWCDIHAVGQAIKKSQLVKLTPAKGKAEKVFACGVEILPEDEDTGKMRTRAHWVAHVPDFSYDEHVAQINLKIDAKRTTNNARLEMDAEPIEF